MNIFFDLDGTLIDSKKRLYQLFNYLVPVSTYSFDQYWALKSEKISHKQILTNIFEYTEDDFATFETKWMVLIEQTEWLSLDKPFEGVTAHLLALKKRHKLFVVTARQFEEVAFNQIKLFGWSDIFTKLFVTEQKLEKFDLINDAVKVSNQDWFIGDTGKDIQTGKLLGIKTAAVLSGFLSKGKLLEYEPDLIVDNVTQLSF